MKSADVRCLRARMEDPLGAALNSCLHHIDRSQMVNRVEFLTIPAPQVRIRGQVVNEVAPRGGLLHRGTIPDVAENQFYLVQR